METNQPTNQPTTGDTTGRRLNAMYKVIPSDTEKSLERKLAKLAKRYPLIWEARDRGFDNKIPQRFIDFVDEADQTIDHIRQVENIIAQREGLHSASDPAWTTELTVEEAGEW